MAEPIAIIGLSFKLPGGGDNESSFWKILEERKNVMTEWPSSRLNIDSFFDADKDKKNVIYSRGAHFLKDDPAAFDAPFFSIAANEAAAIDPQQRLVLEASYRALENAGISVDLVTKSDTAVFSATMTDDYSKMMTKDPGCLPQYSATGVSPNIIANRVSWFFDFRGPSVHVDTACSGSLVALDMACKSLQTDHNHMALVAGSNILFGPEFSLALSNMNFLSPDSRCYSFDHRANGYARGEGVIVLVIKRLSDAIQNGDTVRAVIRSIATNQDGHTPSLTQPSAESQEKLIRTVYRKAGIDYARTRYVEAHGTGTALGDPIEIKAIGEVFRSSRSKDDPLLVGSVKGNIGHLEGASGLASVVKCLIMLEKGIIPPNANFEKLNPRIDAEFLHVKVPTQCTPWPSDGLRRVSINSFGFGGTNCHVVLDDAHHFLHERQLIANHSTTPEPSNLWVEAQHVDRIVPMTNGTSEEGGNGLLTNGVGKESPTRVFRPEQTSFKETTVLKSNGILAPTFGTARLWLLVWSAADKRTLRRLHDDYAAYCSKKLPGTSDALDRLSFTLGSRRSLLKWRSYALIDSPSSLKALESAISEPIRSDSQPVLGFIFTGQGAQHVGMGLELLCFPAFKDVLQTTSTILADLGCSWSIIDEIRNERNINRPEYSQPLCTALQIALIELLRTFGIVPAVVVGHSSGEIAAAYAAGAISLRSACVIAYHRGRLAGKLASTSLPPGSMMSVNLPESAVHGYLQEIGDTNVMRGITTACVNSPSNVTVAGEEGLIDLLKERLDSDGIFAQKLKTGVSYHSAAMAAIASEYKDAMGILEPQQGNSRPTVMISSVDGQPIQCRTLIDATYWVNNMVSPVKFLQSMQYLLKTFPAVTHLIEVGPHSALRRPVEEIVASMPLERNVQYLSTLSRVKSSLNTTFELSGILFAHGYPINLQAVNNDQHCKSRPSLTDAPEYPFDHSQNYWYETRMSRDLRLRKQPPIDLLGTPVMDWNPLEPRWRKTLSIDESPWIGDHVVNSVAIYPAAGLLIMAMEAVKQLAPKDRLPSGFYIKEADFSHAMVVRPGADGNAEANIHVRPLERLYEKDSTAAEVRIYLCRNDGTWVECCRTTIQATYSDQRGEVDRGLEECYEAQKLLQDYQNATRSCTQPIKTEFFYKYHADHDIQWGPSFQNLQEIHWDGAHTATSYLQVLDNEFHRAGIVHPTILDCALQLTWIGPTRGLSRSIPTAVPRRVWNSWVSASGWNYSKTDKIRLMTNSHFKPGARGIEVSTYALADDGSALVSMAGVDLAYTASDESFKNAEKQLCYGLEWKPQLSMLSSKQLGELCRSNCVDSDEEALSLFVQRLIIAISATIENSLQELAQIPERPTAHHLSNYIMWMRNQADITPKQYFKVSHLKELTSCEHLLNDLVKNLGPSVAGWQVVIMIARHLTAILQEDIDPLELLFATEMAENFYELAVQNLFDVRFDALIGLLSHETPELKILEVGAGIGDTTSRIVSSLQRLEREKGGTRFVEFCFTDKSSEFFDEARRKFASIQNRLALKTLDLEKDIGKQGFKNGSYDVIIARNVGPLLQIPLPTAKSLASVLLDISKAHNIAESEFFFKLTNKINSKITHAYKSIPSSLENLRKLLKPQVTHQPHQVHVAFTFGVFPEWRPSIDNSGKWSQYLTEQAWNDVLQQCGYTGNEMVFKDHKDEICHFSSLIVSSLSGPVRVNADRDNSFIFIIDRSSESQTRLANLLISAVEQELGLMSRAISFSETVGKNFVINEIFVSLLEIDEPILQDLAEADFSSLQSLMAGVKCLVWVTSAEFNGLSYPSSGLMRGLMRSLRSENSNQCLVSLTLESEYRDTEERYTAILRVLRACSENLLSRDEEVEYIFRDGYLQTARVTEEREVESTVKSIMYPRLCKKPWDPQDPLSLTIGTPGFLETLRFIPDPAYCTNLGPNEVEIEAKAWGLNFRDILVALGRLEEDTFGFEAAGLITRVGSDCSHFRPGEPVIMVNIGCMKIYPRCDQRLVLKLPQAISLEEAAASAGVGITAYHSLVKVARLQKGEKVLIHSGAGGTGQMAIRVAQMIGAEVFTTVGYDEKKRLLVDNLNIPEDHVFYSRNTSFAKAVMRMTNGYGVDVVLNSLSGDKLVASWECVAPFGRFIEIGKADINNNSGLPMSQFAKNVTFSTVDFVHLASSPLGRDTAQGLLTEFFDLMATKKLLAPFPIHSCPLSAVEEAFRLMQSGKSSGRIVITSQPGDVVPIFDVSHRTWKFDKNATYVIAGGTGGLGRSAARWMVRRGAQNILLLSRSGSSSQETSQLLTDLHQLGVDIRALSCDVTSQHSVQRALDESAQSMPPVKGCLNACMVLQDVLFEKMTYSQWKTTLRSKVETSWNLHTLLPKDLDFFVMLSSLSGIVGTVGQSNYAAGNSYQDSLARYRTSMGQKAIAIDLGLMSEIGIVAENTEFQQKRTKNLISSMTEVNEAEFLSLLDIYCDPDLEVLSPDKSQILVGLGFPNNRTTQGSTAVPEILTRRMFSAFSKPIPSTTTENKTNNNTTSTDITARLFQTATTVEQKRGIAITALTKKLGRILSISAENIDMNKPLAEYGVDSLVAVELRNWIGKEFVTDISVFDIMGGMKIAGMAEFVAANTKGGESVDAH
ncbi:MAG: hypothetical protein Q9227_000444 [Pyrenula ochraceoflavens]